MPFGRVTIPLIIYALRCKNAHKETFSERTKKLQKAMSGILISREH